MWLKVSGRWGLSCLLISSLLFLRMTIELNKALPPDKRISLLETQLRFFEIKSLHETSFPLSKIRTTWFIMTVVAMLLMATGTILAIRPAR
jgi:hypothetical protein